MQGDVPLATGLLSVEVGLLADGGSHGGALEAVPDDVDGQLRGMHHVGAVEAVVAQLVEDYLVGREVCDCLIA